jgi:1-acyl-sn-glycerol-3-phosphate acyltransferase
MKKQKRPNFYWNRPLLSLIRFPLYYFLAMPILALINWLVFDLRIQGRQNLKGVDRAIFICNHMHYLDCTMIALTTFPRQVVFFSQKSNFELPVAGWIIRLTGSLPVGSTHSDIARFQQEAAQKARAGVWLGIFPEGSLALYNRELQPFRKGAFLIARQANVPVIPLAISQRPSRGLRGVLRRKPLLTIRVGTPIMPRRTDDKKADVDALCKRAHQCMKELMQV